MMCKSHLGFRLLIATPLAVCVVLPSFPQPRAGAGRPGPNPNQKQNQNPDPDQTQEPIRVDVNLVLLDATVKNQAGQIMADLKKENFQVREDGVNQKIEFFGRDNCPSMSLWCSI